MAMLNLQADGTVALTPETLACVARGESVSIIQEGVTVARVVASIPALEPTRQAEARRLIEAMLANRDKLRHLGLALGEQELREFRDDHGS